MVDEKAGIRQGHTERDTGFVLHTLLAEQSFEQDDCADENFFLG